MNALVVHASQVLTPHEAIPDGVVVVEDGKITAVGHRDEIEIPAEAPLSVQVARSAYVALPAPHTLSNPITISFQC